jgi:hypothetical protein
MKIDQAICLKIEEALKNRLDFAVHQLYRASVCVPFILDPEERQRVAFEVFSEFNESLELTEKWNTPAAMQMYEDNLETYEFGESLCDYVEMLNTDE